MRNITTATRLVGDTVTNKRKDNDFYATPTWAVEALLQRETFDGAIWEPACGTGAISKVLKLHDYPVLSTDLIDRGYGRVGIDFLRTTVVKDNIITNPPFSHCTEFILKSKSAARNKIAMFMKTTALEGVQRYKMWTDTEFPFARMYQFVRRVSFGKDEGTHKAGGMMAFAWYVWDTSHVGPPTIQWIQ